MKYLICDLTFVSGDSSALAGIDLHPRPCDVLMKLFQKSFGAGDSCHQCCFHIGGNHRPNCSHCSPATNFEALIMNSIATVKANGEMVHPAMMLISSGCQAVVKSDVVRLNYRSWK